MVKYLAVAVIGLALSAPVAPAQTGSARYEWRDRREDVRDRREDWWDRRH